jgi:hypothetical protein
MNAQELAQKFSGKVAASAPERQHQQTVAADNAKSRLDDVVHIKRAMEQQVMPFFTELRQHFGPISFLSHRKSTSTTGRWASLSKSVTERPQPSRPHSARLWWPVWGPVDPQRAFCLYPPDAEPYISNSGDLTREKIAKLVELVIDNSAG